MTLSNTTTMAMISSRWMNPPSVVEVTIPSNHRISKITKIVQSICIALFIQSLVGISRDTRGPDSAVSAALYYAFRLYPPCLTADVTKDPLCIRCRLLQTWKTALTQHGAPRPLEVACEQVLISPRRDVPSVRMGPCPFLVRPHHWHRQSAESPLQFVLALPQHSDLRSAAVPRGYSGCYSIDDLQGLT